MVCTMLAMPSSTLRSNGRCRVDAMAERQADRQADHQRGDADQHMAAEIGGEAREGLGDRGESSVHRRLRSSAAAARPGGAAPCASARAT